MKFGVLSSEFGVRNGMRVKIKVEKEKFFLYNESTTMPIQTSSFWKQEDIKNSGFLFAQE